MVNVTKNEILTGYTNSRSEFQDTYAQPGVISNTSVKYNQPFTLTVINIYVSTYKQQH